MRRLVLAGLTLLAIVAVWFGPTIVRREPVGDQPPRTRHLRPDGTPMYTNRLARERSPYLQQHAHNPVDWFPWGDEAFAKARTEKKPILLSVGYSTCHWCHVMEEESFEDDEIAAYLNAHYVAIKVDREERPDVDAVYMEAVQLMTSGGGGWPMTLWLTPDRRPFWGATYLPPRGGVRGIRVGFLELLQRLAETYASDPARVDVAANDVVARLQAEAPPADTALPGVDALARGSASLTAAYDAEHGGFGVRPKFPRPSALRFLLREHVRTGDPALLGMVVRTLDAMAAGGIHDQVAGGFHRYATDVAWRTPHFEKMLYDNAQLAVAYLEAFQASGRAELADVVRTTLAYLVRDMQAAGGGLHAASDADSNGEEGVYYTWTEAELADALGGDRARLAAAYFDVGDTPTTLATPRPLDAVAASLGIPMDAARSEIDAARVALLEARGRRVAPHVDRKVVAGWNGLAIGAFARAASVLGDPGLAVPAIAAADALLGARRGDRLPRYLLDGEPYGEGYLDDYAFLVSGLLDLYEATYDVRWLREAVALQGVLDAHFADARGGYFLTADDQEGLLRREKPDYDGAEPAGNSVALENCLRLEALTSDDRWRERADGVLGAFGPILAEHPDALPAMLAGLDFSTSRVKEIVLVTPDDGPRARPFLERLATTFVPSRVLAVVTRGAPSTELARLAPVVAEKALIGGAATAYVCERGVCKRPTTDVETFATQLRDRST